jgi:hypothetical protein
MFQSSAATPAQQPVSRQRAGPESRQHQQADTPPDVRIEGCRTFEFPQRRIGHHGHHIDDEQTGSGKAPGQTDRQQRRQQQFARSTHERRHLRRQQRHGVFLPEQEQGGVPVFDLGQARLDEDPCDEQAQAEQQQRLDLVCKTRQRGAQVVHADDDCVHFSCSLYEVLAASRT